MRNRAASLAFVGATLLVSAGCEERPSVITLPTAPKPPGPGTIRDAAPAFPGGDTRETGFVPAGDDEPS